MIHMSLTKVFDHHTRKKMSSDGVGKICTLLKLFRHLVPKPWVQT